MGKITRRHAVGIALLALALPLSGCSDRQQSTQKATEPAMPITLDGRADDWVDIAPVLQEAGLPGRGDRNGFDIKRVYLQADAQNLYVFARCTPSIAQQFEEAPDPAGGQLFNLYLDIDNQRETGSTEQLGGFHDAVGFDRRLWFTVGVTRGGGQPPRNPTATVFAFPDVNFQTKPGWKSTSSHSDAKIAHGPDGVESAIPLEAVGLKPGVTVRLLLWEHANFSSREGFNEFMFTVPAQDAQ
jgi:hypothetical protein